MTCNQTDQVVPRVLRGETTAEVRLDAIAHLRTCVECRKIYFQYQNIFYSIDRNIVLPENLLEMDSLRDDVRQAIKTDVKSITVKPYYFIYAAAAVLLILAVIYSFSNGLFTLTQDLSPKESSLSLKEHLEDENWQKLNSILNDPQRMYLYLDEKIPLSLLREKLMDLQKTGVYSISYTYPSPPDGYAKIDIPLKALLGALDRYRQGSAASIRDLSKLGKIS